MTKSTGQVRRNRIILVGLFAMALVPLVVAFVLYESSRTTGPWGTTNLGELLDPIRSVGELSLTSADDGATMVNSGHWWLATVTDDGCAEQCQAAVHQLRQLHILLGRDSSRVKRSLIAVGSTPIDPSLAQYPDLARFSGQPGVLRAGVYIVDPLGNIVLRYEYQAAGKPVLEDLKKMLKVSHIG